MLYSFDNNCLHWKDYEPKNNNYIDYFDSWELKVKNILLHIFPLFNFKFICVLKTKKKTNYQNKNGQ